ncbi:unnamed protein product [Allacma fusca]|uniref:Uncharacterized protein n=1 Tax=Allacma fusca TaxID=39272 RepID=A0A8J2KHW1_9HEXA|nr:unnamed protein product [Allacma fusca]
MDVLAQRHSCWYKLKWRTAVWVMLWRQKQHPAATGFPKATELEDAERRWIRYVQKQAFQMEIQAMVKGKPVPSNPKLKSLCHFIQHELIMVGSRLRNSERKFWILRGKAQLKKIICSCKTFRIHTSATLVQLMADLPKARVTPGRPFTYVGIDYAGLFQIRDSCINRRKAPMVKAYATIFICFSTNILKS